MPTNPRKKASQRPKFASKNEKFALYFAGGMIICSEDFPNLGVFDDGEYPLSYLNDTPICRRSDRTAAQRAPASLKAEA
jgi:hypothetical protein